jgi:hypothetical protein
MFKFKRTIHPKSVMFAVEYEDGRTGYLVVEGHGGPGEDYLATSIAKEQQAAGLLPEGTITRIKRVR